MFQIKICGITSVEDAQMVARAGADAIGLNFYPKSPRYIDLEQARAIVRAIPSGIAKVGLFVNAPTNQIRRIFHDLRLDLVQLHGDEAPDTLAQLGECPVMRAFRLTEAGLGPVLNYLSACRQLGCLPRFTLLDAYCPGHYGGTGQAADWRLAAGYQTGVSAPSLVLAGGLKAENVGEAIRIVRPVAVDTASGVECEVGRKDPERVEQFVAAARGALRR